MPSFYDLLKYAKTGIASADMTDYDKVKARIFYPSGYPVTTLTGIPPISFRSDGTPLTAWQIDGNMVQDGTPTPDAPITPQECGNLAETGEHAGQYAVPITCAGQTQTIYLSEPLRKIGDYSDSMQYTTQTATRRIGKMILDGTSTKFISKAFAGSFVIRINDGKFHEIASLCSHFIYSSITSQNPGHYFIPASAATNQFNFWWDSTKTLTEANQWLADQYTAGTPVTVWYVLANPTTETVTAPTITPHRGSNTLTVDTDLQPSNVSITGHIKPV